MKIKLILFFFVLASACAPVLCDKEDPTVLQPEAPVETRSRFAALDDVRLLANGLLQLGQSLREFVHKTKGQINDIFQKLNIFDRSFYQLSVLASEIKEEEEELKKTTVVLKANNEEIKGLSVQISSKVDSILQEKSGLQNKVEGLEEKLSSLSQGLLTGEQIAEINSLRAVIHSQERSITDLLNAVREQSDQLNHQRIKIKSLEEKLTANTFAQETIERMPEMLTNEAPTLTPYLTSPTNRMMGEMDLPLDCSELYNRGERASGVYAIRPNRSQPFMAFCDMSKDHGATVIQRRRDGSVNFDQTWEKYENGFGDFQGEFWLGLRKILSLAAQGKSVLHIQLEDWKQNRRLFEYRFYLGGPESNYTIHLTHLSGDLPEPMSNHTGMRFSTKDRDNDKNQDSNCVHYSGGWWFNACGDTNLNGRYFYMRPKGRSERRKGIQWKPSRKASYSLKFTQISVYPMAHHRTTSSTSASSETGFFL
ncbi:angiopoietin-related protein 3-like isoform X1 [Scomber scombrus]|uniref:angiopoietin-related protein 3-like isoform X1 n=1 Tax=Scomber scombrus TaxID=13677 RepID=UPI002DDC6772|nr:angiopoietin-related protein 3-like isoform X1 [Scomber scombrus]